MNGEAYEQADNARKYFTACFWPSTSSCFCGARTATNWPTSTSKTAVGFVGNTVSGEESDILEVVNFLADFLNSDAQTKTWLADLIADRAQILDAKGNNIFSGRFTPLMGFGKVDELYADIPLRVSTPRPPRLKLVNIKSSKGGAGAACGRCRPFGLINIGDDAGFFGMAEDLEAFDSERDDFGGALFGTLNNKDSNSTC